MEFIPYVAKVRPPRAVAESSGGNAPAQRAIRSMVYPISVVVDLNLQPAGGERDYFLWHPDQESVQDVLIGVEADVTAPTGFEASLVRVFNGVTSSLTSPQRISSFTIEPTSLPLPGQVLDGVVFLRVTAPATDLRLLVTIHVLTSEIN